MRLEINKNYSDLDNNQINFGNKSIMFFAPGMQEDYIFRVRLSDKQSIVGFSKFSVIGIGFLVEKEDGNTNLPSNVPAKKIYDHIEVNKGDDSITEEDCIKAIKMIQRAAKAMEDAENESKYIIAMKNEPLLVGKNGKIISKTAFAKISHIASYGKGQRKKHVVMFGYIPETGGWRYKIGCRNLHTKSDAITYSRKLLIDYVTEGRETYWGGATYIQKAREGERFRVPIAF